jgi:site-specific recombinase XerD
MLKKSSPLKQLGQMEPNLGKDIFIHFNHMPLTRYQFTSVLKKALNFLNIKKGHFRSHSFRIGGATELARQGVPEKEIMKVYPEKTQVA